MPGIGVVLNPNSRSNRRNPQRADRLAFIVGDRGACKATRDIPGLTAVAREFLARDIEVLGISGGDGTIHHTLSHFVDVYGDKPLPMIALLRGGTVNNVAGGLNIRGTPEDILSRLIVQYHESKPFDTIGVNLLRVNNHYGFNFGSGIAAHLIRAYKAVEFGGKWSIAAMITRCALSCLLHTRYFLQTIGPRFDADVVLDGVRWPYRNYTCLYASTVQTYALIAPFQAVMQHPDHCEIIGLSAVPRKIVAEFVRAALTKRHDPEHHLQDIAREVAITTRHPMEYMIDGEWYPAVRELRLSAGPRLTMIRV